MMLRMALLHVVALNTELSNEAALSVSENQQAEIVLSDAYAATGRGSWREDIGPLRASNSSYQENLAVFAINDFKEGTFSECDEVTNTITSSSDRVRATPIVCTKTFDIPGNWIGRKPENGGNAVEPMHDVSPCLAVADRHGVVCLEHEMTDEALAFRAAGQDGFTPSPVAPPICASTGGGSGPPTILFKFMVRRLTPLECERLQGLPDHYTRVPTNAKGQILKDGPRYKALGNSWAAPNVTWIGNRINEMLKAIDHQHD